MLHFFISTRIINIQKEKSWTRKKIISMSTVPYRYNTIDEWCSTHIVIFLGRKEKLFPWESDFFCSDNTLVITQKHGRWKGGNNFKNLWYLISHKVYQRQRKVATIVRQAGREMPSEKKIQLKVFAYNQSFTFFASLSP